MTTHARGSSARILLSSVTGPYGVDDEQGSRALNPMELYHNQVTRVQGPFSIRLFHRSFGLMMLQSNIDAPCTLLDFPTQERFVEELRNRPYDVVGISSIIPNVAKVARMCRLVREIQPEATVVVGGHVANMPGISGRIDADHIVRGEGVRWFRRFLGQPEDSPLRHPVTLSAFGGRALGLPITNNPRDTAAILLPSVGCPIGCNFCATSAMFGGKGKFINFYESGDDLFSVMCGLEKELKVRSFFALDENFLLHKRRALRLLELMKEHHKSWSIYVFSSGRVLGMYSMEQLIGLGISWVWMGLEGEESGYDKLRGVDTQSLVRDLQGHGIRVLGSTILGLEEHTPGGMAEVIDHAVRHDADLHQFMLYTPVPGTPLYEEHRRSGTLLDEKDCPVEDTHGQLRFSFRHPHIRNGEERSFLLDAFRRDYQVNGPSLARMFRTTLQGWRRYRNHPEPRIRKRYAEEVRDLRGTHAGALWAMKRWGGESRDRIAEVLRQVYREFGWWTRVKARLFGPVISLAARREERRLARGMTYEPATFYEKNPAALALDHALGTPSRASAIRSVTARPV